MLTDVQDTDGCGSGTDEVSSPNASQRGLWQVQSFTSSHWNLLTWVGSILHESKYFLPQFRYILCIFRTIIVYSYESHGR
jgi:hypothetical protein